jgi:hypothetical protein
VLLGTVIVVAGRPRETIAAADIVVYAAEPARRAGTWQVVPDSTAAGGSRLEQPNAGAARITAPLANPVHYVEYPIVVEANTSYHLWIRGKAKDNFGDNDSVWVQTSGTIDGSGAQIYRIGTTSATMINLQECSGCTISGWGWQDNGFAGATPPLLTFATGGAQTLRIQAREDGISIDQIVLSDTTYLTSAPGSARNDTTILPKTGGSSTITLVRGPYLQQVGDASAIVAWATRQPGPASVLHWTGTQAASTTAAATVFRSSSSTGVPDYYQHEAVIQGLSANTTYQYDLRVRGEDPTPGIVDRLRTAPQSGTGTIKLVAFGDSGVGSAAQQEIATLVNGETFDLAIHTGDIAYSSGTYAEFDARFFPYYSSWLRAKAVFPVIGNHENITGSATPYRTLFVLPRDGASPAFPNNAERFYSFDYGPVHFVMLDTESAFLNAARRDEQLAWLESDLQGAQSQPWRIVVFHRPPYSSSKHGSDLAIRQAFRPIFERWGVDLVLNGHDHNYERTLPQRESTNPSDQAVTYIVTGGGGAPLYPSGKQSFTAFSRSVHHYVRVTISSSAITLQAVDVNGTVFDAVTLSR